MASSANFHIGKNKFMGEEVELSNKMQENDVWRKDQCYQLFKVEFSLKTYSHGQELFYKFVSNFTNKLVKQLLSMTVDMGFSNH